MKISLMGIAVSLLIANLGKAQQATTNEAIEKEIRTLEQGQIDYLLKGDTLAFAQ